MMSTVTNEQMNIWSAKVSTSDCKLRFYAARCSSASSWGVAIVLATVLLAFQVQAQLAWHRTIGGGSHEIRAQNTLATDNGLWVSLYFTGQFNLNENTSAPPMLVESLLNQNLTYVYPSFAVAWFNQDGVAEKVMVFHPSDPGMLLDQMFVYPVMNTPDGGLVIAFNGDNGTFDIDPGVGSQLVNLTSEIRVAHYDGGGNLTAHGSCMTEYAHGCKGVTGFYLHEITQYPQDIYNLDLQGAGNSIEIPATSEQLAILNRYDLNLGLQWSQVLGTEPGASVISNGAYELADGRTLWFVANNGNTAVDVDPSGIVVHLPENAARCLVYDADGNYLNMISLYPPLIGEVTQLPSGEIRIFGAFYGSSNIGGTSVTAYAQRDHFIASFSSDLQLNWVHHASGVSNIGHMLGSFSESTNGISFWHQEGALDLDVTPVGFILSESDAQSVLKTDAHGAILGSAEFNAVAASTIQFFNDNSQAIFLRHKDPNDQTLTMNGVNLDFNTGNGTGLQMVGLDFDEHGTFEVQGFHDSDLDGTWDNGESPLGLGNLLTCPELNASTNADSDGWFRFNAQPGAYHFTLDLPLYRYVTTGQQLPISTVILNDSVTTATVIGIGEQPNVTDISADVLLTGPLRPGFDTDVIISLYNHGTVTSSGQLVLHVPSFVITGETEPVASLSGGDSVVWNIGPIPPLGSQSYSLTVTTMNDISLMGDSAHFSGKITPLQVDFNPIDNSFELIDQVVAAYDPNDKKVNPTESAPDSDHTSGVAPLNYLIRFQNTGNYPTEFVHVIDTISESLDISTFRMISSSHPCEFTIRPDRSITWRFDPLALNPVSEDPLGSIGYIQFSMKLMPASLVSLDSVINRANIYFDFNPHIVTDWATFRVDPLLGANQFPIDQEPVLVLYPNPASQTLRFKVQGSGFQVQSVAVIDMLGHMVLNSPPGKEGPGEVSFEMDISTLAPGLYTVSATLLSGATLRQRLVVQR
jgi:hypothetical protein